MSSVEELKAQVQRVDQEIRNDNPVDADEKTINITSHFNRYRWGAGVPNPLPPEALSQLGFVERTTDERWIQHFRRNAGKHVAVYRSLVGYYWLLRYESGLGEHWLDHIGTAHDTAARFGPR